MDVSRHQGRECGMPMSRETSITTAEADTTSPDSGVKAHPLLHRGVLFASTAMTGVRGR